MNHHEDKALDDYTVLLVKSGIAPNSLRFHVLYTTASSVEQAQMDARIQAARNDLLVDLHAHIDNYGVLYVALGHHRNLVQHKPLPTKLP